MPSALALKALELAVARIGTKEDPIGSNWGPNITYWLARVHIFKPAPWCMAFAWSTVDDACQALHMPNPLPCTGGVMDMYHQLQNSKFHSGLLVQLPAPGDIFIMDLGKGLGHCGFVETIFDDHVKLKTIDGNTNADGGREGYEVERKDRHQGKPIIAYIRY